MVYPPSIPPSFSPLPFPSESPTFYISLENKEASKKK